MADTNPRPRRSRFDIGPSPDPLSIVSATHSSLETETVSQCDGSEQTSTRTRRSRFDLPPAAPLSTESLFTLPAIDASQPRFGVGSSEAALSYLTAPVRPEFSDTAAKTFSLGGYEIVLHRKLERAMTRNFEYLLRKDASPLLPVEQLPRLSTWGAGKDFARAKKQATPGEHSHHLVLPMTLVRSQEWEPQAHRALRRCKPLLPLRPAQFMSVAFLWTLMRMT